MTTPIPYVDYIRDEPWWVAPERDWLPAVTNPPELPWRNGVLLGHWDEERWEDGGTFMSNYTANKGVDNDMRLLVPGSPSHVSQVMKAYPQLWQTDYTNSSVKESAEFGNAFCTTQWNPGDHQDIIDGVYDVQIAAWFNSIPVTQTAYTLFQNEPDNPNKGNDPLLFNQACAHVINIGAPIHRSRGLPGGIGTVFMCPNHVDLGVYFETWNFLQYVDPVNLPQVVYCLDRYSKYLDEDATTYESIPGYVEQMFEPARVYGCTRFGIPEFGIGRTMRDRAGLGEIATAGDQQAWLEAEMPKICAIDGLEFAIYFHKRDGTESTYNQLVDDATGTPLTTYANQIVEE